MTRPPRIRLVVLLENLEFGDSQRYAVQLLQQLDRAWFAPEVWVLGGGEDLAPVTRAAGVEVVHLCDGRRIGPAAWARFAMRLWRGRPDLLYTIGTLPNLWGRLIGGLMRIPVISDYRGLVPRQHERLLHRFSARIIADNAALKDVMTQRLRIEPDRIAVISNGVDGGACSPDDARVVRQTELVLREVAQRGTTWTATADGEVPQELPLWPDAATTTPSETIIERGKFRPDRSLRNVSAATLTVHLPPPKNASGAAVVICPGGGYETITIDKEGHDVARWLTTLGVAGLVLKYRLPRGQLAADEKPWPLQDVERALRLARDRAGEWRINPRRLGVMGFSAGGHMAASASNVDRDLAFAVLVYPVISLDQKLTHEGSRLRLLGARPALGMVERYSFENHPTAQTCPTFLVHARDDDVVNVDNSILYADALRRAGVAHQFLLYERGGHGFGLGLRDSNVAEWPVRSMEWLQAQGLLRRPSALSFQSAARP